MQLQMFKNENLGQVRVLGNNENPLFCLRDICEVLEHTNSSRMLEAINAEFGKGVTQSYHLQTNGGIQQATFITEPQLYFVLMRSDKPKAKPFRQWVVNEVLPSIRKNGSYGSTNTDLLAEHNLLESCAIMADFAQNAHFLAKVLRKLAQKYEANAQFAESRLKSALKHRPDVLKKARNISKDNESSRIELKFFLH